MSENVFPLTHLNGANAMAYYVGYRTGAAEVYDILTWCQEQFGEPCRERYVIDSGIGRTIIYFSETADAMAFAMRWQ